MLRTASRGGHSMCYEAMRQNTLSMKERNRAGLCAFFSPILSQVQVTFLDTFRSPFPPLFSEMHKSHKTKLTSHNLLRASPIFHPASNAIISAARSPIPNTVNIGFAVVISGNTPASATLTPFNPRSLNPGSTTAISSRSTSPIFVVPAG